MKKRRRIYKTLVLFIGGLLFMFSVATTASKWNGEETTVVVKDESRMHVEATLSDHLEPLPVLLEKTEQAQKI